MLKFALIACVFGAVALASEIEIQGASERFFLGKKTHYLELLSHFLFMNLLRIMLH